MATASRTLIEKEKIIVLDNWTLRLGQQIRLISFDIIIIIIYKY